jgi:hypothetical protein
MGVSPEIGSDRIRWADDPAFPGSVLVERWEALPLRHGTDHRPCGWRPLAWYPDVGAAKRTLTQVAGLGGPNAASAQALLEALAAMVH